MSWYVEYLLLNRETIRAQTLYSQSQIFDDNYTLDYNNDDYNNLLILEKKLVYIIEKKLLTDKELQILNAVMTNKSLVEIGKVLGITRFTLSKFFNTICDRLAFLLGNEFSDEGYLEHMQESYKLTDEQIEKVKEYMKSNQRHSIRRTV